MKLSEVFKNKRILLIAGGVFFLLIISTILLILFLNKSSDKADDERVPPTEEAPKTPELTQAEMDGMKLSNGKCTGKGPVTLSRSPMDPEDFSILIPYGLMVGGHVTPIDHQYFAPKNQNSARDSYEVYAMADGRIVDISARPRTAQNNPNDKFEEYRIVFSHTCTFLTYYDLVTSLSPELKVEYDKVKSENGYAGSIDFPVKAGDLIGRIGGQTLDFAVWDTEKKLTGFIVPEHYEGEAWKIFTANPYDYMTEELKSFLVERNPRTVEPIQGKIDYDIDGKLIGSWFVEGTNGYRGADQAEYWETHLSVAPNHYDPSKYIISLGDYGGEAKQFTTLAKTFNPAEIGVDTGLVKVDLAGIRYTQSNGASWNGNTLIKSPKLVTGTLSEGCVLFELQSSRILKMQSFPAKKCSSVSGFTVGSKLYER